MGVTERTGNGVRERMTTARALVRFLSVQYSVTDGERLRLIPAFLGIFGHGNVTGLGEALWANRHVMPHLQGHHEQGMCHIATAFGGSRSEGAHSR